MTPIPMLLWCPTCHAQHIDEPEAKAIHGHPEGLEVEFSWDNPPHKSHLCHACGEIWRPADVETTGVTTIETRGKADTWPGAASAEREVVAAQWRARLTGAATLESSLIVNAPPELWCVHLTHSDEAIAALSWFEACRVVDDHNIALGYLDAEVVRWPHSAEGHAHDVAAGWRKFADDTAERRRVAVSFRLSKRKASQ